jgi:uncharacterized repeat protein (TIGR03803 family)
MNNRLAISVFCDISRRKGMQGLCLAVHMLGTTVRTSRLRTTLAIVYLALATTAMASPPQIDQDPARRVQYADLVNFDGTNGDNPYMNLVKGTDGNLYGTTGFGGAYGGGEVFSLTPTGGMTLLYSFCEQTKCTDGSAPNGLVLGTDGNFYGTSASGGSGPSSSCPPFEGCGTVFTITPSGALTTLYNFCSLPDCTDGSTPGASLVLGPDGNFYGTTTSGGANVNSAACVANYSQCGTVFKITPGGLLTTIYSFCSQANCADGNYPETALVSGRDGNLYGTTASGGAYDFNGTFFRITPEGALTTLYSFCAQSNCPDGSYPAGGLIQAIDGNFYGTTVVGGVSGDGTVFKFTPRGKLTTLHSFDDSTNDGGIPDGGLLQGSDGNLYGTTMDGGEDRECDGGCGTVFELTLTGEFKLLQSFGVAGFAGSGLAQATNGTFYGSTLVGENDDGTLFSLSVGLRPFVETVPNSGNVGEAVTILGNDLTDAAHVRFNRTDAVFKVVSDSEIQATVPAGATTGFVTVEKRGLTILKSNLQFQVRPQI